MVYSILITVSLSSVFQSAFIIYLWSKLYYDTPLLTYEYPEAIASAPTLKGL